MAVPPENNQYMDRVILHLIATIKYRFDHAVEGADDQYWSLNPGNGVRTPLEILYHMRGLMYYANKVITGERTSMKEMEDSTSELRQFYESMEHLKKECRYKRIGDGRVLTNDPGTTFGCFNSYWTVGNVAPNEQSTY